MDDYEVKKIPLDELEIGTSQARTRNVGRGIDELANSIKKVGLLEPIVVQRLASGRFEIVTGQRRFLAHQKLGEKTILAQILSRSVDKTMAKAISLTENMLREDMDQKDYIDACTELYRKYGSIKAVSEELGLPVNRVSEYVKFDQLVPALQETVKAGRIDLPTALRAQKAASAEDGEIDADKALALAQEMAGLSAVQQKQIAKVAKEDPDASIDEVIEAGRRQPKVKQIVLTITDSLDSALGRFAAEEGANKDDAAINLIEAGLVDRGYSG